MREATRSMLMLAAALCVPLLFCGCESNSDEYLDHDPPDGQGSLVIDNSTAYDVQLFLNGEAQMEIDYAAYDIVDLAPGVYRVVLTESDGFRSFRDDVDILAGTLTVLLVDVVSSNSQNFTVDVEFHPK